MSDFTKKETTIIDPVNTGRKVNVVLNGSVGALAVSLTAADGSVTDTDDLATFAEQQTQTTALGSIDNRLADGVVVTGNVAAAATDSGNPVKIGGKYNTTKPTLTDGQRGNVELTTRGALTASLVAHDTATAISAEVDNLDDVAGSSTANNLSVVNRNTVYDGSNWDRMRGDQTDGVLVNLGTNNDVNVTQLAGNAVTLGAGSVAAGTLRVTHASDDPVNTAVTSKYLTTIGHGVKTVTTAGTDVALAASTPCKRVIVQSQTDNTSLIAVGGSGVDAPEAAGTGIILYPGDCFEMDIDNLADVFIDSLVNGEGVRFTYFN